MNDFYLLGNFVIQDCVRFYGIHSKVAVTALKALYKEFRRGNKIKWFQYLKIKAARGVDKIGKQWT